MADTEVPVKAAIQSEKDSSPHQRLRDASCSDPPGIDITKGATGVIYASDRAAEHGYLDHPELWANLGQGAPEAGDDIPGCRKKPMSIPCDLDSREYGSNFGIKPLREAVAKLYNAHHRKGMDSQYTWENVCIVPGGRAGLIRIASCIKNSYLGFFVPDYTAYNEMLSLFKDFVAIPVPLDESDGYHIHPEKVEDELKRGVTVILTSNPRNPTGEVMRNPDLAKVQDLCRDRCTLIFDEFYAGYQYPGFEDNEELGDTVSSASNIIDVDKDDVLIIDGMTKRFRLPGWRICWVIGPKQFIKMIGTSGSYLDGGTNVPLQQACVDMLEPTQVREEMVALQKHFRMKRDYVLGRLHDMGFAIKRIPDSTFYIWLDLKDLPHENLRIGLNFFEELLHEKVICVPGIFFDLNPAARRDLFSSPCHHHVRLSYGPPMDVLERGLDGIEKVLQKYGVRPRKKTSADDMERRASVASVGTKKDIHMLEL